MKLCVIGAGVSGLVVSRYMKNVCDVSVFEATNTIGGVWLYNDITPMYQNLQTNLTKHLMEFKDLKYPDKTQDFLTHTHVMEYLDEYCKLFELKRLIQFNTRVSSVKPRGAHGSPDFKWIVKSKRGVEVFDAVAVCSGKYDTPSIPSLPGQDTFKGQILHSKAYCTPQEFVGKCVLTVGSRSSGTDIVLDLWKNGVKVIMSQRTGSLLPGIPDDIEQVPEIDCMNETLVTFKDGTMRHIDVILFATGYDTNLGYLDPLCGIQTDILPRPLYKYFINCKYPTMTIFDQAYQIAPFLFSEYQALYLKKIICGAVVLPTEADMLAEVDKVMESKAHLPLKYKYSLKLDQFSYYEELTGFTEDLSDLCELYRILGVDRGSNPLFYREKSYALGENGYEVVE